jgi:hypothetical protein
MISVIGTLSAEIGLEIVERRHPVTLAALLVQRTYQRLPSG